jgi:3-phenylpropionate/trans-cinnamate dioxygenase ferredoxin reductase subunit
MSGNGMVIVGAGEAGARAAAALREQGYDGSVTLIGEEPHGPYERPPLSKAVMTAVGEPVAATILTPEKLAEHRIEFLADAVATGIDRAGRAVQLADGRSIPYAKLLLATGARPRRLSLPGDDGRAMLYLRTWADALALRSRLKPGSRLAIIGGGFIGLEIAASAVERGCAVTVVEAAPRIMMRGVPAEVAAIVGERHVRAGIALRVGIGLTGVEHSGQGTKLLLADGSCIEADAIVAGVGAVPETGLAEQAGLAIDNGIRADERLATSDPDIFAAGDCCSFPHPLYGGRRIRLEAWRNAQDQGTHAARSMLGGSQAFTAVPWFWSDQHDLCLQIAGLPDEGVTTVVREDGEGGMTLRFHLDAEGRLVAASGVGPIGKIAREVRVGELLIAKRAHPDPAALASSSVKLKSLLAA